MGDQDTGSLCSPVFSGLQVPGESGHCHARKRPLGDLIESIRIMSCIGINLCL